MEHSSLMAYMMDSWWGSGDGCMGGYGGWGFPFFGMWGMMLVWFIVFLIIGYFVYQDANKRGMNGLLWGILIIIPMIGILALILYVILRESGGNKITDGKTAMDILKERYAKGEITSEQFQTMSEELKK
ncbi:MAG: SHOCT domain-containing protein [Methanoregula sp.]|jgi:putative membrane protein